MNTNISMTMLSKEEYNYHCAIQRKKKVTIMCAPIRKLRGKNANDLLDLSKQLESVPVDLNIILKSVGISALPCDFSMIEACIQKEDSSKRVKVHGAIATKGNHAAIFYDQRIQRDSHRCRFTIAHELAHCCLSHDCANQEIHIDFRIEGKDLTEDEKAANVFAGELLIPEKMLMGTIKRLLLPSVHTLASVFDVSDNVMIKRLEYLKISENISGYNF